MIVDSSALIAILRREPGFEVFRHALGSADRPRMSAATLVEVAMVAGLARHEDLDRLLDGVEVIAFDRAQALVAREGFLRFGRGSGSKARLNLGDSYAYALAMTTGEPLLFKGDDFTHTDVVPAV